MHPQRQDGTLAQRFGAPQRDQLNHRKQKETFIAFLRILLKYLEQKDKTLHAKAKAVIKDCAEQNASGMPGYESVAVAMQRRLKDLVGKAYWKKAQEFLVLQVKMRQQYLAQEKLAQAQRRTALPKPAV